MKGCNTFQAQGLIMEYSILGTHLNASSSGFNRFTFYESIDWKTQTYEISY